ncbi:MAG: AarF/UbiB family protein [Pyrinomonadaceae bacterium]
MNITERIENVKRYKDITMLLVKYGRSDLVKQAGMSGALAEDQELSEEETAKAGEFAKDLEDLGSTFIKLGQLLSTRADIFPAEYLKALERLQDNVEPFSFGEVEKIVAEELGVRLSKAFSDFESEPAAAASIGQVHRAKLRDGKRVVVKVQRPGIREEVYHDLEALDEIAALIDSKTKLGKRYEFQNTLVQLRKSLMNELDYTREASSLIILNKNLKDFENIIVPLPVQDYTTSRVLTMDFIDGKKVTDLSELALLEIDRKSLADEVFHAYIHQILADGFFHADPHPGNIFITKSGQIALLDLGMTGRLSSGFRDNLLDLLLSISEGRGDDVAHTARKMGEEKEDFDKKEFENSIADLVVSHIETNLAKLNAGKVVLEITKISADCGFRLPPEFTMVAKTLLNLDRAVYKLDPEFDPNASIRKHAASIVSDRVTEKASPGAVLSSAIELKQLAENIPPSLNKILDTIANNKLKVEVDAIDEKTLMVGFQKVANRIAMGLVLAALIIGASMLMNIETSVQIAGYPALALILFLAAVTGGVFMIYTIVFTDEE